MAASFVGKKLGELILVLQYKPLHLLTVSKSRNVSPTENKVAKHWAISFLVGGPGPLNMRGQLFHQLSWQPLRSAFLGRHEHLVQEAQPFKDEYRPFVFWQLIQRLFV